MGPQSCPASGVILGLGPRTHPSAPSERAWFCTPHPHITDATPADRWVPGLKARDDTVGVAALRHHPSPSTHHDAMPAARWVPGLKPGMTSVGMAAALATQRPPFRARPGTQGLVRRTARRPSSLPRPTREPHHAAAAVDGRRVGGAGPVGARRPWRQPAHPRLLCPNRPRRSRTRRDGVVRGLRRRLPGARRHRQHALAQGAFLSRLWRRRGHARSRRHRRALARR